MSVFQRVQLRQVVQNVATWNPLKAATDETFHYIDLSAIDQKSKKITGSREVSCGEAPSRARQLVAKNDVLVSTVRPNLNGVAIVTQELDGATASTGFCVVRPNPEKLDPNYLFHWVKSETFVSEMVQQATGASYPAISDKIILGSHVPLPTIAEQRRIAVILDKVDTLRATRWETLAQLDNLAQSIFIEMFGDPDAYEQKPLAAMCDLITDGTHQTPTYADEGVIFLSAKNVTSGEIDWENIKFIPQSLHQELHRRLAPRLGDILLAKNGTTGVAAVVDRNCVFDVYVSLALLRPRTDVLSSYLHAAINSQVCKKQFNGALKGIGVPNLHLKDIRQTTVPHPPLGKQKEFVNCINTVAKLKNRSRAGLTKTESLCSALQDRAFRGAL